MIKSYFKKLLSIILFIILFIPFTYIYILVSMLIGTSQFNPDYPLSSIFIFSIYSIATLALLIIIKVTNKAINFDINYKNFILEKLKSKDNLSRILAWLTVIIPSILFIAISNKAPLLPAILGTLIILIVSIVIVEIINFIIWSLAYVFKKSKK